MNWSNAADVARLNLVAAWLGLLLAFLSGSVLGVGFHQEGWLGGYASFQRRLYRLGHISFFGLAAVNFMFFVTARLGGLKGSGTPVASIALLIGAISMPACCFLMAHFPRVRLLFAVPVLSLLFGAAVTLFALL
jgi:hypothetical protein